MGNDVPPKAPGFHEDNSEAPESKEYMPKPNIDARQVLAEDPDVVAAHEKLKTADQEHLLAFAEESNKEIAKTANTEVKVILNNAVA